MNEISTEELYRMPRGSYELIDIRDKSLTLYGMIPGAINIPLNELESRNCTEVEAIPKDKALIFYCQIGRKSKEIDDLACLFGRNCFSLGGGYIGYVKAALLCDSEQDATKKKAEESIRRKFKVLSEGRIHPGDEITVIAE